MPVLTLEVIGGLCSRLRTLVGALAYCEETGKELRVNWCTRERNFKYGFPARIPDLFTNSIPSQDTRVATNKNASALSTDGDVFLRTCHIEHFMEYFTKPISYYWGLLKPSDAVRDAIQSVALPDTYKGVHIRYEQRQPNTSPPEWQIERMRTHSGEFFLSCDSADVSRKVHQEVSGVIEQAKDYEYDVVGIQKSLADLYILIDSEWLIGANHSSYSQLAALVRGAKYLGSHEKPAGIQGGRYEDKWNEAVPDDAS